MQPSPQTAPEWVRRTNQRIQQLEGASFVNVGPWSIKAKDGELVAQTVGRDDVALTVPQSEAVVAPLVQRSIGDLIAELVSAITNGVSETLEGLVQWGTDLLENAGAVIGNIWNVLVEGANTVGDWFKKTIDGLLGKAWTQATGILGDLWDAAQKLFGKSDTAYNYALAPRVFGAWQANLTDDVSFAQSLIDAKEKPLDSQRILIPLVAHKERFDIDSVKFGMYGSPTFCHAALYRVQRQDSEPDVYGNIAKAGDATLLMDLGDITNLCASSAQLKIIKFADTQDAIGNANPELIGVSSGDIIYLELVQTGSIVEMATWSQVTELTSGLQPPGLKLARAGSWSSTPQNDKFNASDVVKTGTGVAQYWGSMGRAESQLEVVGKKFYSDYFNRELGYDTVGPNWVIRKNGTYDPKVFKPRITAKLNVSPSLGENGLVSGACWTANVGRFASITGQEVRGSLWWSTEAQGLGGTNETVTVNFFLHGDGVGKWVYAEITYNPQASQWETRIYTFANNLSVERGLTNDGSKAGPFILPFSQYPNIQDDFRFTVENENTYQVRFRVGPEQYDNWQIASKWVDFGNIFPVTESHTEWGVMTPVKLGGTVIRQISLIDNVVAQDL